MRDLEADELDTWVRALKGEVPSAERVVELIEAIEEARQCVADLERQLDEANDRLRHAGIDEQTVEHLRIEHNGNDEWTGYIAGKKVAWFEYIADPSGHMWLCDATTAGEWQCKGVGKRMIAAAVEAYGEVYASTARKSEMSDGDTRWLTEHGAWLVNSCIRAGIMKRPWLRHPLGDGDDDGADEGHEINEYEPPSDEP